MATPPANEPLITWAQSSDLLRKALGIPQPVSILVAFETGELHVKEIAQGSGFGYRVVDLDQPTVPEAATIYLPVTGAFLSVLQGENKTPLINARKRSYDEIEKSELQLFDVFSNTQEGIFIYAIEPGGRFKLEKINKAGERLTGVSAAETEGKYVDTVYPDYLLQSVQKSYDNCIANNDFADFETPTTLNEEISALKISVMVVRDGQGKPCRMIGITRDITEQRRMLEESSALTGMLGKRAAELAESNAELERFAYIASHDLQEPLRMVSSFLQLLKKRYNNQLDETALQYIHFAVDGSERMKRLIHDLLEYSRLGSNKEDTSQVDLNMLLFDVTSMFSESIKETGARVDTGLLPVVIGKKIQLMQLFQNLFSNAIKYRGKEPPLIRVSCADKNDHWQFCVADNGIGIDPKFKEKIFVIFQRLHNKTEYSGTGIGLAICKKIVERHGGKMWVESEAGKGCAFYFTIAKG